MKHKIPFGRVNKRTFFLLLTVFSCLLVAGCGKNRTDSIPLEALAEENSTETKENESTEEVTAVDVYLVTTPSMVGYLGLKYNDQENQEISEEILDEYGELVPETAYMETLEILNDAILQQWAVAERHFYRFDVGVAEMTDMNYFVEDAVQSPFYIKTYYELALEDGTATMRDWFGNNTPEDYDYTERYLSEAIDFLDQSHVSIVITDLYELADNTNALFDAIARKIVDTDNVLSLIGIQSEFAGLIYDLDRYQSDIPYGIQSFVNEPSEAGIKYHPFYLLIFGKEEAVTDITEKLMSDLNEMYDEGDAQDRVKNQMFICKIQMTGIDDYSFKEAYPISRDGFQYDTSIRLTAEEGKSVPENFYVYKINRKTFDEEQELTHTFRVENSDLKAFLTELGQNISQQIQSSCEVEIQNLETGEFEKAPASDGTLQITEVQWNGEELQVSVSLKNADRMAKGLYRFRILLFCPAEKQKAEAWVSEWDLDKSRINEWLLEPENFEGEKTNNLEEIVEIMLQRTDPEYDSHEIAYLDYFFNIN